LRHKTFAMIKKEVFDNDLQEMARFAKAISHPARLAILNYLAETKTCISGDISNYIPLSRTTVSQHLKELKRVGLIDGEIDGPKVCYCVNSKNLSKAKAALDKMFSKIGCC